MRHREKENGRVKQADDQRDKEKGWQFTSLKRSRGVHNIMKHKLIFETETTKMLAKVDHTRTIDELTREERGSIAETLKCMVLTVKRARPIEEAIITRGGVSIKEIDPRTMESKLLPGLYFAGEVIDADACTGGFNLQIAWSTGFVAGRSAAGASEY